MHKRYIGHMKQRLQWLDAARGIAALAVLAAHLLFPYWRAGERIFQFGNAGVVLFFLISGYIIPMSLDRPHFWRRRILRLYPLYWIVILVQAQGVPVWNVLANLTMVPIYFNIPLITTVGWSLAVELTFYVLMSLRLPHVPAMLVLMIANTVLLYAGHHWVFDFGVVYLPICMAGTLWYRHDNNMLSKPALRLLGLVTMLYILTLPISTNWLFAWVLALISFALLHRFKPAPHPLTWIGVRSYSLYLLHPFALAWSMFWGLPVAFILAAASYRFIERPAIHAKIQRWKKLPLSQ
jgi:peptidoglycan/LPS O-acetylase OafA/YrhL